MRDASRAMLVALGAAVPSDALADDLAKNFALTELLGDDRPV